MKGSKAAGLRYERRAGKFLKGLGLSGKIYSGQWIQFEDEAGKGFAQPDHFIVYSDKILLIECKLSQVRAAWGQMRDLYRPLLEEIFEREIVCVQMCRHLKEDDGTLVNSLSKIYDGATLHWLS